MNTRIESLITCTFAFGAIAIVATTIGCQRPGFESVYGIVTLDGKPLPDVEVQFLPLPNQSTNHPSTSAYTDASGEYSIIATGSYGVLVGVHNVCINDATVMMPSSNLGADDGSQPTGGKAKKTKSICRISQIYSDDQKTPFSQIEIRSGSPQHAFALVSNIGDAPRAK